VDDLKTFPERDIDSSNTVWQVLAAIIDGNDDVEATERLNTLGIEQLRIFRFQVDRARQLVYNVQGRKMREAEEALRQEHESTVKKPAAG